MDAIKFIEERNRMCESFGTKCKGCPAFNESRCVVSSASTLDAKEQVVMVEDWSAAHLRKTRQDVFLEQYPETVLDEYGVITICPMDISTTHRNSDGLCRYTESLCMDCRREFWMQEIE
jgi:hypothetical protein